MQALSGFGRPMPPGEMIGLMLAILGGIMDNTGVSVQRLALKSGQDWRHPRWIAGLALYLTGTVLNGIGLGLAPASMVALLSPIVLVYNVINAVLVLDEKLTGRIMTGTLIIIVGSGLAIALGSRSTEPLLFRVDDFVANLLSPGFIAYFITLVAFMVMLMAGAYRYRHPDLGTDRPLNTDRLVLDETLSDDESSLPASSNRIATSAWRQTPILVSPEVAFPILTGCLASLTTLTWKCCIELLKSSLHGYPAFRYLWTYLLLATVVVLGSAQVYMLNVSMRYCKQLSMIPALVVTNEFLSIIGGGIFFNEMADFTFGQAIEFVASILLITIGIYLVGSGQMRDQIKLLRSGDADGIVVKRVEPSSKTPALGEDVEERQLSPLMFDVPLV